MVVPWATRTAKEEPGESYRTRRSENTSSSSEGGGGGDNTAQGTCQPGEHVLSQLLCADDVPRSGFSRGGTGKETRGQKRGYDFCLGESFSAAEQQRRTRVRIRGEGQRFRCSK